MKRSSPGTPAECELHPISLREVQRLSCRWKYQPFRAFQIWQWCMEWKLSQLLKGCSHGWKDSWWRKRYFWRTKKPFSLQVQLLLIILRTVRLQLCCPSLFMMWPLSRVGSTLFFILDSIWIGFCHHPNVRALSLQRCLVCLKRTRVHFLS